MSMASVVLDVLKSEELVYPEPRSVLVVGAGTERMPEWEEAGFTPCYQDIAPHTNPDILGSMTELPKWLSGHFNLVFCCHALEHLYPHEVTWALQEFKRVLKPSGVAIIMVPDLEDVRPTEDVLYRTEDGPFCGLHLYYGDAREIPVHPYMAHHCGFTADTLRSALFQAGFDSVTTNRMSNYNLCGAGLKKAA